MAVEILSGVVRVCAFELIGLRTREGLVAWVGLEVELDPEGFSLLVDPSEGVASVAIHVPESIGGSSVAEEHGDLVSAFWNETQEVPKHVSVLEVGLRIPLLSVDEIWEFWGVSDEEDGSVVSSHVVIALFGVELDGKSTWVSFRVGRAFLSSHSGETSEHGSPLPHLVEEFGLAVFRHVCSDFEIAVCA